MPAEAPPLGETLLEQSDHCTSCSTPMLSASTGQPIWLLAATKVYLKLADACSDPSAWPGVFRRVPAADYDIGLIEAACIGVAAIALQSIQRLSIT